LLIAWSPLNLELVGGCLIAGCVVLIEVNSSGGTPPEVLQTPKPSMPPGVGHGFDRSNDCRSYGVDTHEGENFGRGSSWALPLDARSWPLTEIERTLFRLRPLVMGAFGHTATKKHLMRPP
jgi:hypothetical protein